MKEITKVRELCWGRTGKRRYEEGLGGRPSICLKPCNTVRINQLLRGKDADTE